jgi:hypothetical protein
MRAKLRKNNFAVMLVAAKISQTEMLAIPVAKADRR